MAMPSPASDSMAMDFAMMAGISRFHLQEKKPHKENLINIKK